MSPMLTNLGSCCAWNFGGSGGTLGFSADSAAMAETLNKSPAPPRAKTYLCMVPPILLDAGTDLGQHLHSPFSACFFQIPNGAFRRRGILQLVAAMTLPPVLPPLPSAGRSPPGPSRLALPPGERRPSNPASRPSSASAAALRRRSHGHIAA